MDTRKSRLVVKRSVKKAVMGIMMAFTSVNPVVSHWAVDLSLIHILPPSTSTLFGRGAR